MGKNFLLFRVLLLPLFISRGPFAIFYHVIISTLRCYAYAPGQEFFISYLGATERIDVVYIRVYTLRCNYFVTVRVFPFCTPPVVLCGTNWISRYVRSLEGRYLQAETASVRVSIARTMHSWRSLDSGLSDQ